MRIYPKVTEKAAIAYKNGDVVEVVTVDWFVEMTKMEFDSSELELIKAPQDSETDIDCAQIGAMLFVVVEFSDEKVTLESWNRASGELLRNSILNGGFIYA